jgi:hypothetical protein
MSVARVYTKPGCPASRAVELLNGKWDVVELIEDCHHCSTQDTLPPLFTEQKLVDVDELQEEMEESGGEFPGETIIRAKWMLDGCSTMDEIIETLKANVQHYEKLKEEGYVVEDPVGDDYGRLSIGIKTESASVSPPLPPTR